MQQQQNLVNTKKELTFYPSKLASISLPVSKPKSNYYERTNGRDSLILESGGWKNPKTKELEAIGLPYGIIPRHTLLYLCQQYHRNKKDKQNPRVIELETTIPAFLEAINCSKGGTSYKRIMKQVEKLLSARITIIQEGEGRRLTSRHNFTDKVALWWDAKQINNQSLFKTYAEISKLLEVIFKKSIPLNLETVKKIGGNCLELDLYIWLNYRHYSLIKPYIIGLKELHQQLGANYKHVFQFKPKITKAFKNILDVYQHNSKITENGILLKNSKTDIDNKHSSILKAEKNPKIVTKEQDRKVRNILNYRNKKK